MDSIINVESSSLSSLLNQRNYMYFESQATYQKPSSIKNSPAREMNSSSEKQTSPKRSVLDSDVNILSALGGGSRSNFTLKGFNEINDNDENNANVIDQINNAVSNTDANEITFSNNVNIRSSNSINVSNSQSITAGPAGKSSSNDIPEKENIGGARTSPQENTSEQIEHTSADNSYNYSQDFQMYPPGNQPYLYQNQYHMYNSMQNQNFGISPQYYFPNMYSLPGMYIPMQPNMEYQIGQPNQRMMQMYYEQPRWYQPMEMQSANQLNVNQPFLFMAEKMSAYSCMDPINYGSYNVFTLTGLKNYVMQQNSIKSIARSDSQSKLQDVNNIEEDFDFPNYDVNLEGYLVITSNKEANMTDIFKLLTNGNIEEIKKEELTYCLFDKLDDDKTFGKIILDVQNKKIKEKSGEIEKKNVEENVEETEISNKEIKSNDLPLLEQLVKICQEEISYKNYRLTSANLTITSPVLITGLSCKYVDKTNDSIEFFGSQINSPKIVMPFIRQITEINKTTKIFMGVITHKEGLYEDPEKRRLPFYRFNIKDHQGIITVIVRGPHAPTTYYDFNKDDIVIIRNAFVQDYNFKYKLCRGVNNPLCLYVERDTIVTLVPKK